MDPKKVTKIDTNDGYYGVLEVCKSGAGYYIGRIFHNKEGYMEPGSRETDYYKTKEEAENALQTNSWKWRDAPENRFLYDKEKSMDM
jgi:hypothetical protein